MVHARSRISPAQTLRHTVASTATSGASLTAPHPSSWVDGCQESTPCSLALLGKWHCCAPAALHNRCQCRCSSAAAGAGSASRGCSTQGAAELSDPRELLLLAAAAGTPAAAPPAVSAAAAAGRIARWYAPGLSGGRQNLCRKHTRQTSAFMIWDVVGDVLWVTTPMRQ
jgi:hypothetical protein